MNELEQLLDRLMEQTVYLHEAKDRFGQMVFSGQLRRVRTEIAEYAESRYEAGREGM